MSVERGMQMGAAGSVGGATYVEDVFSTYLYTGTGASQTITNGINLSTKGGMVWMKGRSSGNHILQDTARGENNYLMSDSTAATQTLPGTNFMFGASGFSMNNNYLGWNTNGNSYASWTFRKQRKFFDVVTYTGNGVAGRQISHALGATPGMIIVKSISSGTYGWGVYHSSTGPTKFMYLNDTSGPLVNSTAWNDTLPTASTFTVGSGPVVNQSGQTFVAYLFADSNSGGFGPAGTDSIVACGSYNAASSGSVNLGWEPQFLLLKSSSAGGPWYIVDTMRGWTNNLGYAELKANLSDAESVTGTPFLGVTPTGFSYLGQGNDWIYMAIRRGPMKIPTDATKVFNPQVVAGSSSYSVGFPTDFCLAGDQSGNALNTVAVYRLAGNSAYFGGTASTAAEQSASVCRFDLQNSFQLSYNSNNQARWHFQRAPSFMDVVCYTGTGSATTVAHNLGVVPEIIITKKRNNIGQWNTWHSGLSATDYIVLNSTEPKNDYTGSGVWNDGSKSSTTFSVGTLSGGPNASGDTYVAYLFATCPGVSKVGSYTGTGTTNQINCGFTNGARFVLIKRTDSTGGWYVWDSARGIIAGNDPYLLMNSTAAEVTNTDYIDPYSPGFELSSTAPAALNANGGTYIFLAIA